MKTDVMAGAFGGMLIGVVVAVILLIVCNKDRRIRTRYDERQKLLQGKSYQWGFNIMIGCEAVLIALKASDAELPVADSVLQFFVMIMGVAGYVTHAIMHDAYFGLNNKIGRYLLVFAIVAAVNVLSSVCCAISGELIVDGQLGTMGIGILCSALFVWIFIVLLIRKLSDEKED